MRGRGRGRLLALFALVAAGALGVGWLVGATETGQRSQPTPIAASPPAPPSPVVSASPSPPTLAQAAPVATPKPPAPPIRARPGLAFILNSADASISVFDVSTRKEVRRIPVVREPHHMALTPDHRSLVIGDTGANELLFIDPVTGDLQRRMPVSDPYQFAFSPDGKWLVINALLRNQIDLYDAATMRLISRVPAYGMPSHLNFSPDSKTVFVTLQSSDSVIAIDVASGKTLWKEVVGPTPAGILWNRGKLLVGVMGADYVAVVNPANGQVERRVRTAKGAHVLFVPGDGKVIYVTNRVDGSLVVLDPDTLAELRRFRIPGGPDDLDFGPDGKIWVARRWAQSVAVIDPVTGAGESYPTGRSPHGIWLNTHDELPAAPVPQTGDASGAPKTRS